MDKGNKEIGVNEFFIMWDGPHVCKWRRYNFLGVFFVWSWLSFSCVVLLWELKFCVTCRLFLWPMLVASRCVWRNCELLAGRMTWRFLCCLLKSQYVPSSCHQHEHHMVCYSALGSLLLLLQGRICLWVDYVLQEIREGIFLTIKSRSCICCLQFTPPCSPGDIQWPPVVGTSRSFSSVADVQFPLWALCGALGWCFPSVSSWGCSSVRDPGFCHPWIQSRVGYWIKW